MSVFFKNKDWLDVALDNDISKYNIAQHTYPSDLFHSDTKKNYGNCYVLININVQNNSVAARSEEIHSLDRWETAKAKITETESRNRADSMVGVVGKLATVTAVGSVLPDVLNGKIATDLVGVAAKGVQGAAAGAISAIPIIAAGQAFRGTKRLKTAIALPMPNALAVNYGLSWNSESTRLYDLMNRAFNVVGEGLRNNKDWESLSQVSKEMGDLAAGAVLGVSGGFGAGSISIASGLASNPKSEQLFQGVAHRTFSMAYKLFPKSKEEADTIRDIIYALKYHAHPEYMSATRATFIYPSEFDITFYVMLTDFDGNTVDNQWAFENAYVSRIASCVLNSVAVDYAPDAMWNSFEDGVPSMISLTLNFSELGILTKESIEQGF